MAISARAAALRDLSRRRRDVVAEMANSLPALGRAPVDAPKPFDDGADAEPDADADDVVAPVPEPEMERRTGVMDRQPARIGPVTMEVLGRKLAQNPPPQAGAPDFGELPPVGDDPRGVMAAPPALRGEFKRLDADMGGADGEPPTDAPAVEAALPEASRRRVISPSESMPAPPVPMPEDGPAPDKRPMMQVAQRLTAQDGDAPAPEAPAEPSLLDRIASLRKKRDTMNQSGWIDRVGSNLFGALTGQKPNYSFAEGLKKDNADALANVGGDMAADAKLASADPKSDVSRRAREFWRANFKSTPIADDASADDIKGMLSFQKQGDSTRKVDAVVTDTESKVGRRESQNELDAKKGVGIDAKIQDALADNARQGGEATSRAADRIADNAQNKANEGGKNARFAGKLSADTEYRAGVLGNQDESRESREKLAREGMASRERVAGFAREAAVARANEARAFSREMKDLSLLPQLAKAATPVAEAVTALADFDKMFPDLPDVLKAAPDLLESIVALAPWGLGSNVTDKETQRYQVARDSVRALMQKAQTGLAGSEKELADIRERYGAGVFSDPDKFLLALPAIASALKAKLMATEAGYPTVRGQYRADGGVSSADPVLNKPFAGGTADKVSVQLADGTTGKIPREKLEEWKKRHPDGKVLTP